MTDLIVNENNEIDWSNKEAVAEIKKIFAPLATDNEFKVYINMSKSLGLNPFLGEIDCIKYDPKQAAAFVIRRDGYRKTAQNNPDYISHKVDAIYSEDTFEFDNGKINHKYSFTKRGVLLGAYALVYTRKQEEPVYRYVLLSEYDKGQSCWKNMKETMIKKVAEAQTLRAAFQEFYANTMTEDEYNMAKEERLKETPLNKQTQALKDKIIDAEPQEAPAEPTPEVNPDAPIAQDQVIAINDLIAEKGLESERLTKALAYFKVDCVESMNMKQAETFLMQLRKI